VPRGVFEVCEARYFKVGMQIEHGEYWRSFDILTPNGVFRVT